MVESRDKLRELLNNRWLVFVASMWVQSCSGIGYLFGSISPVIKKTMGYNQRQIAMLGVAKDLGDAIGYIAGTLCEILPIWAVLAIGVVQNFVGYGLVWLIVSRIIPTAPLWVLCILIFVGTNGETYFNTGALVACIQNFPEHRGPIVGILKGFAGLSGAIMTQVYVMINLPNEAALIFVVAVGPSMVITALMFIVKPVGGSRQARPSDNSSFLFVYSVCLILAAYLLGVLLLQDLVNLNQNIITIMSILLLFVVLLPVLIPILLVFTSKPISSTEVSLLSESEKHPATTSEQSFSETEDLLVSEVDLIPELAKESQEAAEGTVTVKQSRRPRIGEDHTLMQAFKTTDFWLVFISLVLASGSGMTVIDNLGQMSQSLGYENTHVFVSMISIWNFLGRVAGGYFSEIVVRKYAYPRLAAMAVVQILMAIALSFYALGAPGAIYVVSVLMGLGYGAHWAIVPAAASELFGIKSFGALYNFLTLSSPAGSLFLSGVIASGIYDSQAKKQASIIPQDLAPLLRMPLGEEQALECYGTICYSITCTLLTVLCVIASVLSLIVVYRTKKVYAKLFGNSNRDH